MSSVWCFFKSTRQICNHLCLKSIKTALKTLIFLKKWIFALFYPKNREVIENSSKTPLNFRPFQCIYLGKYSFQHLWGLVRKKEIEKWLLRTSVQCSLYCGLLFSPVKTAIQGPGSSWLHSQGFYPNSCCRYTCI